MPSFLSHMRNRLTYTAYTLQLFYVIYAKDFCGRKTSLLNTAGDFVIDCLYQPARAAAAQGGLMPLFHIYFLTISARPIISTTFTEFSRLVELWL